MTNTPKLPEDLDKLINGVVRRIEQQNGKREEGATKAVMILKHEIAQELSTLKAQVRKEIEELKKERLYHWRNYGDIDGSDEYSEGIVENYKDAPDVADGSGCKFVWNEALNGCLSISSLKEE